MSSELVNSVDELIISLGLYDKFTKSRNNACSVTEDEDGKELIENCLRNQFITGFIAGIILIADYSVDIAKKSDDNSSLIACKKIVDYVSSIVNSIEE